MKCKTCLEKYCEDCGKKIDNTDFSQENYWRIDVDGSKSTQDIYKECEKLFPCWKLDNIDISNIKNDRTGSYTVYFRKNVEADEEFKDMSAYDLKDNGVQCITLKERLLLELEYFKETGKHLDIDNWTLCAGSRTSNGKAIIVNWYYDKLCVRCCYIDDADDDIRTRQAVFTNT